MNILVTGGAGYIGSHTILELIELGYKSIVSADCFLNSSEQTFQRIRKIAGIEIKNVAIDLTQKEAVNQLFTEHSFDAVIHFAALKSVPESVEKPNFYYRNNLNSLINVLDAMLENKVNKLIFSSSCSVYGNPSTLPVTEAEPFGEAESPYAHTKQIGEDIIKNFCKVNPEFKSVSLRYFNPAGAHPSALIGEESSERPNNLVPIITQTAAGLREKMMVFGDDYNTPDGSCIRDYIHVMDIANAHVKAIEYLQAIEDNYTVINLGTGKGSTVLELINAFEKVSETKLNYEIGGRRAGDVETIYANNFKAKEALNWEANSSLEEILRSAWEWQKSQL